MKTTELTRRAFLEKAAAAGALTLGASLIAACKPNEGADKGGDAKPADKPADKPAAGCTDVSALTDAEMANRNALKYVDKSPDPAKNCSGCALYTPGSPCGGCTVIKGPIAPDATCTAFAPKA